MCYLVTEREEANDATHKDENLEQEDEEKLEEALNDENVESVEEIIEKDSEAIKEDLPILERQTLLSQYGAKKVIFIHVLYFCRQNILLWYII